jgi:hypothetical protein
MWLFSLFAPPRPEISLQSARDRASRGAAYLDDVDPGWHERIDLEELALASGEACVLGQLHGDFRFGLGRSRLVNFTSAPKASLSPVAYGFFAHEHPNDANQAREYELLDSAWMEEIQKRTATPSIAIAGRSVTTDRRTPAPSEALE